VPATLRTIPDTDYQEAPHPALSKSSPLSPTTTASPEWCYSLAKSLKSSLMTDATMWEPTIKHNHIASLVLNQ